jgi:hypothetical protein
VHGRRDRLLEELVHQVRLTRELSERLAAAYADELLESQAFTQELLERFDRSFTAVVDELRAQRRVLLRLVDERPAG